jgi:three-Cys-motif partner protein
VAKHEFGGDWTTDKLERVRKYLCAYMTIFTRNPKAQYFTTVYVDAFAGTGHRAGAPRRGGKRAAPGEAADPEAESFKKGSARIALEVDPSFNRFIFIERDADRVKELEALRDRFPNKAQDVRVEQGDANAFLKQWCKETDWKKHRAVVFLDPYGMQVDGETLEALAGTRAIDLWLLFPLGVAVNRLLTKVGPPPDEWANALTRIFGTKDWEKAFYPKKREEMLWGPEETQRKEATLQAIGRFFLDRLKTIFAKVAANPLPLWNSKGTPIYLLCFAAGNPKGAPTAVRIAQDILKA